MAKQSSPEMSSLAARVLGGYAPTPEEVRSLAASVLAQDETPNDPAEEAEATAAPFQTFGDDPLGR